MKKELMEEGINTNKTSGMGDEHLYSSSVGVENAGITGFRHTRQGPEIPG
jgi:hypothetical protein